MSARSVAGAFRRFRDRAATGKAPRKRMERVTCPECGKNVAARIPRGGDGSALQPVAHKGPDTKPDHVCPGHWRLVDAPGHEG